MRNRIALILLLLCACSESHRVGGQLPPNEIRHAFKLSVEQLRAFYKCPDDCGRSMPIVRAEHKTEDAYDLLACEDAERVYGGPPLRFNFFFITGRAADGRADFLASSEDPGAICYTPLSPGMIPEKLVFPKLEPEIVEISIYVTRNVWTVEGFTHARSSESSEWMVLRMSPGEFERMADGGIVALPPFSPRYVPVGETELIDWINLANDRLPECKLSCQFVGIRVAGDLTVISLEADALPFLVEGWLPIAKTGDSFFEIRVHSISTEYDLEFLVLHAGSNDPLPARATTRVRLPVDRKLALFLALRRKGGAWEYWSAEQLVVDGSRGGRVALRPVARVSDVKLDSGVLSH